MIDPNSSMGTGMAPFCPDPQATVESLLDLIGDWLTYVGGMHEVLADMAADPEPPDRHQLACMLGTVALLIRQSESCIRQVKFRYVREAGEMTGGD